jgi:hypothetical protein
MKFRCISTLAALCVLSALPVALGQPGPGQNKPAKETLGPTKVESPPFFAEMLLVKADWSKVPAAKEIEAELRAALKDAAIPKDKLAELPASGAQIFFAPELVAHYQGEQWAEFTAWLAAKGLLEKVEAFPAVKQFEGAPGVEQPYFTQLRKSHEFVEVPWSPQLYDQPFITRRPQFHWELDSQEGKHFVALRELVVVEQSRGETEPTKKDSLETANWEFDLEPGQAAVVNAFPGRGDRDLRASAQSKGFAAVLVVSRSTGSLPNEKRTPRLHLPQSVKPLTIVSRSNAFRSPSGGSRGGGRTGTSSTTGSGVPPGASGGSAFSGSGSRPGRNVAPPSIKVFTLLNAKAASVAKIVDQLWPGLVNLAVDERTNSIIATGTEEALAPIEALLIRLDQPTEDASAAPRTTTPPATDGRSAAARYHNAEQEASDVAKTLHQTLGQPNRNGRQIEELRALLRKKVAVAFAARQELLKFELVELQNRMRELGETIESRNHISEQIIDRRVQDLLNPGVRWDSGETPAESNPGKSQRSSSATGATGSGTFDSGGARNTSPVKKDDSALEPTLPFAPAPSAKAISDKVAPTAIWDDLGLKLEVVSAEKLGHKALRGGLRIVELKPDGPAAREGLRVGDILIGLHVWETISLDNVLYVLTNVPRGETEDPIKYILLRGDQAISGYIAIPRRSQGTTP